MQVAAGRVQSDAWSKKSLSARSRGVSLGCAALVEELSPLLHKLAQGREISGLSAYEE